MQRISQSRYLNLDYGKRLFKLFSLFFLIYLLNILRLNFKSLKEILKSISLVIYDVGQVAPARLGLTIVSLRDIIQ